MAYVTLEDHYESPTRIRKKIYDTLWTMAMAGSTQRQPRIMSVHPEASWKNVWKNLHDAWIAPTIHTVWYQVIYDIVPTNDRLARIHLSDTAQCPHCGRTNTILRRLTECNDTAQIWNWTRARIAMMLRTEPRHVRPEWTIRPEFHFWPPRRRGAILWLIAHMVYYCIQNRKRLIDTDYADFPRRAWWKSYQKAHRLQRIGNYLIVLSE
jgi:hypothetical protein